MLELMSALKCLDNRGRIGGGVVGKYIGSVMFCRFKS